MATYKIETYKDKYTDLWTYYVREEMSGRRVSYGSEVFFTRAGARRRALRVAKRDAKVQRRVRAHDPARQVEKVEL